MSWTCCDCCDGRDDVVLTPTDNPDLAAAAVGGRAWLCAHCRAGLCPDCGPT